MAMEQDNFYTKFPEAYSIFKDCEEKAILGLNYTQFVMRVSKLNKIIGVFSKLKVVKHYKSFSEFYPFYLTQHTKPHTKLFHFIGTTLGLLIFFWFVSDFALSEKPDYRKFPLALVCAYFFAWISHAFIELNKPATFTYPVWSFFGDLVMWSEII